MSHYDRGPYAPPSEPPLTMDHRRPPRGGGPAPVTLIVSVLLLAAAAGGVFYLYRGGARDSSGVPRPVGAPIGEVKVAAPPQAQPEDPAAGLSIYRDSPGAAPPAKAKLVPKPIAVAVAEPPPDVAAAPPVSTGPAMVQIGAFSSAALADKGWSADAAVAPGAMAGKGKKVEQITKDGGALYRTSITGFASREEAKALCDKLKAAGKSCFVK